jgi:hypothetical protein
MQKKTVISVKAGIVVALVLFLLAGGCSTDKNSSGEIMNSEIDALAKSLSEKSLDSFGQKRILFGHQSVGEDIINGLKELFKTQYKDRQLNITEFANSKPDSPGLYHFHVGKNRNPELKINHFKEVILNGAGNDFDIIMMKLCYVDIVKNSTDETDSLFDLYVASVQEIKEKFPQLKVIHCTVPLKTRDTFEKGKKAEIKRFLMSLTGKRANDESNAKREYFNQKIRQKFAGADLVFDIAKIEALKSLKSSDMLSDNSNSKSPLFLQPGLSNDGGHLNELGQKWVAAHFLNLF